MKQLLWKQTTILFSIMGMSTILFDFNYTPMIPPLHQLRQNLALQCIKEFMNLINVFAPLAPTLSSSKIVSTLLVLHSPNIDSPYLDSLLNFQPNSNLKLFVDSFKLTFLHMFHLSDGGPFGMVLEHLQKYFDPKDSTSGFISLHQLCFHVVAGYIFGSMVWFICAS